MTPARFWTGLFLVSALTMAPSLRGQVIPTWRWQHGHTYALFGGVAFGSSVIIFNGSGSAKVVRVLAIRTPSMLIEAGAAGTQVTNFTLSATASGGTDCVALTPRKLDSQNPDPPVQLVFNAAPCGIGGAGEPAVSYDLGTCANNVDETIGAESPQFVCYDYRARGHTAITLREGEGIKVRNNADAQAGATRAIVEFEVR